MEEGKTPNFVCPAHAFHGTLFQGHCLGCPDPLEWPANSRDLISCFFVQRVLTKEEFYRAKPKSQINWRSEFTKFL